MRLPRVTTALGSLALLFGGCAAPPPLEEREQREEAQPPSLFRLFEAPLTPALPGQALPGTPLWSVPLLLSGSSGDERLEVGARLHRAPAPGSPTVGPPVLAVERASRSRPTRSSWRFRLGYRPDPIWLQRRSSVETIPLFESPRIGRMLADGPRAGALGRFTGLLTSEDGPALVGGYRSDF